MSVHRSCGWLAAACVLFVCRLRRPAHAALRSDTPVWRALDGVRKRAVELQGRDVPRSRRARRVVGPRRRLRRGDRAVRHRAQLGPRSTSTSPSHAATGFRSSGSCSARHGGSRSARQDTRRVRRVPGHPTPKAYARLLGEIAAHSRGVIDDWEIRNEPDGDWAYRGTAKDYARELRTLPRRSTRPTRVRGS